MRRGRRRPRMNADEAHRTQLQMLRLGRDRTRESRGVCRPERFGQDDGAAGSGIVGCRPAAVGRKTGRHDAGAPTRSRHKSPGAFPFPCQTPCSCGGISTSARALATAENPRPKTSASRSPSKGSPGQTLPGSTALSSTTPTISRSIAVPCATAVPQSACRFPHPRSHTESCFCRQCPGSSPKKRVSIRAPLTCASARGEPPRSFSRRRLTLGG